MAVLDFPLVFPGVGVDRLLNFEAASCLKLSSGFLYKR